MARGKPSLLSRPAGSKKRAESKRESESLFSAESLDKTLPYELRPYPAARAAWRQILKAHDSLPGELFSSLDKDYLVGFCLAVQNRKNALDLNRQLTVKYSKGQADLEDLLKVRAEVRQSIRLVSDMEKQLFASPKSRGGVTPAPRELSADEIIANELRELDKMIGDKK